MKMSLHNWIRAACSDSVHNNTSIYDCFCFRFDDHFTTLKSNTIAALKKNNMKIKGDFFEELCYDLIRAGAFPLLQLTYLWKFRDVPDNVRSLLGLSNQDMGIDLVGCTATAWVAIQCKYRKRPNYTKRPDGVPIRWQLPWGELATFLALAGNGPFNRFVVMTSAESIRWQGHKDARCLTLARGSFLGINREIWDKLSGDVGHQLSSTPTQDHLKARNAWLDRLTSEKSSHQ